MLSFAIRVAGADRIKLTTDQTAAAGSPPGQYLIAGRETTSDGTAARLADGTLAGGVATMDQMVRLVARLPGVGLRDAVRMASVSEYGLRTRGRADLVVLTPDLHVRLTMVGGRVVHG